MRSCVLLPLAIAVAIALAAASPALAQPHVLVRAETRIELRVHRAPQQVVVEGVLRDDRGDPLAGRPITIRVIDPLTQVSQGQERLTTGANGAISAAFPLAVGRYQVRARFEGDEHHRGVEVGQGLDLDRSHVRLSLSALGDERLEMLDLDRPHHDLRISATSPEGGAGLTVQLSNETDALASGTTDARGELTLRVPSAALGEPAAGRLVVRTEGDARRAEAQTEVLVVRFRATQLSLEIRPTQIEPGAAIDVSGVLRDSAGPIPRRAVGVYTGEEHLATLLTAEDGSFARTIELEASPGTIGIGARYESDAPWLPSATADEVAVRVVESTSASFLWLLVPMLLCGLGVYFVSKRARTIQVAAQPKPPEPPGVRLATATRRGVPLHHVAGRLFDADSDEPLEGAAIVMTRGDEKLRAETSAEGRFLLEDVADGQWQLDAFGVGYQARSTTVQLPHRGALSEIEIRLRSLRTAALIHYEPLADALAPEPRWWAFWTARELATRAPRGARREIETLTEEVERAAYAQAGPSREDVDEIGERARALEPRIGP